MFHHAVTRLSDNITVMNLAKIQGGRSAITARLPAIAGVYAWFQNHTEQLTDGEPQDPTALATLLVELAENKHCIDRTGRIPPLYEVILRSRKRMPREKKDALHRLCDDASFRKQIQSVLSLSFLFQQPLYVGKATSLTSRIDQHLSANSHLRSLCRSVNIEIERCWLLFVTMDAFTHSSEDDELTAENTVEDLLSRMFHPRFTSRFG